MKKIASLLMGLVMLASTTFGQATQETKKQTEKAKTSTQSSTGAKLKKDGTPDKRYKNNKEDKTVKLKKDGTPDKRYKGARKG